jgi:hypothetical protein
VRRLLVAQPYFQWDNWSFRQTQPAEEDKVALRHFTPAEIVITRDQAARILRFFFPGQPLPPNSLTNDDISYAQALLVEAVDASTEIGYVQVLFDSAFMKVPEDFSFIKDIAKGFGKQAAKNWFRHASGKDLSDPQIYESVLKTVSWKQGSTWQIRMQTGELTY